MPKGKRAYKYRFYPTEEQAHNLACTFGCARFIYNWALNKRKRAYFEQGKKKQNAQSATYTANAFTLKGDQLTLAKHKQPLRIVWSRPLPEGAQPSSVTVSKDRSGRYFVSILIEEGIKPLLQGEQHVGLDVGLKSMVILSTGEAIDNPKYYAKAEKHLARAQRKHTRKKKGSKNRDKARKKVSRLHARIADKRRDYQHKLSTRIIRLETLTVDVREWACPLCGVCHDRDVNAACNILAARVGQAIPDEAGRSRL